ncbi:nitrate reductase molybdenum cofactor assembly chaperone [Melaminivora alkalimesophila]|uniref:Respiratory nitrate reductase chaperone NarJ n=1 Tax=Melaminivora alkalimesophila TaxID=1165852 RepID=A0A317R8H5_9BURK|nr:nitrate reductase molybdenum cofactor assembly chaperone [Melaminivora alkalimesophila]PWW44387.1 respiratory nitrate reductase chaperone NarJ [Melaminivora alkalimesophila]
MQATQAPAADASARVAGRHPGAVTLRVLAALLSYPDAALRAHLPELAPLLAADGVLSASRRAGVAALVQHLAGSDPLAAETEYVELFDRGRATSLYLFEHVHGDSRDRGPAMLDLGETYAKAGLLLIEDELPDYLPAVLEFVSTQPPREAKGFLSEIAHLLDAVHAALQRRDSPYVAVLAALLELAGHKPQAQHAEAPAEPSLDESWEEPAAFDGCSSQGQARPGQPQPIHIVRKNPTPPQGA